MSVFFNIVMAIVFGFFFGIGWFINGMIHEYNETKRGHWMVNASEKEIRDYVNDLKKVYR